MAKKAISNSPAPLRVGVAGLGVVGAGVLRLLDEHAEVLAARTGRLIKVVAVSARDRRKKRDMPKAAGAGMPKPRIWQRIRTSRWLSN